MHKVDSMFFRNRLAMLRGGLSAALWLVAVATSAVAADESATKLKVGVAQLALEPSLTANRDKIVRFIHEAKDRGCRVVVFPETALFWQPVTPKTEIDEAVELLRKAVDGSDVYALIGGLYKRDEKEKPFERLLVIDPEGRIVQTYNKMWHDARFNECPGIFKIDGVPCAAALCADRWIRSVEELPAIAGAKILFECSNNYDNEWLPDLGWYWYVPRALRNEVYVVFANTAKEDRGQLTPGHGHSALIGPDGAILAAEGEESDKLLVAELDLARATGGQALTRRNHPVFKPFWETGVALLGGKGASGPLYQPLVSPQIELRIAAAQMACSRQISDNVERIEKLVREAKSQNADVVVFPELAVTGAREDDIRLASPQQLADALTKLQQAAKQSQIYLVCGLPWLEGDQRQNCAIAIGPDGTLLARYAQLVVDRPKVFTAGTGSRPMWFDVKGVPCVMTVGRDALWNEIAEMAAWRGAQVHLHLAYDRDTSPEGQLKRNQLWANLASFRTFTATVNAASPAGLANPSEFASGGSAIWDDFHRASSGKAGGYVPHSAVRLVEAKEAETILFATQKVPKTNPQFGILTEKTNRPMTPWYATGAQAIYAEATPQGPYVDGKFRGRIAYSADGNHNDPDDWAASPVALAIIAEAGLKDRLVHFDYNCILPETNPDWEKTHAESVLGAASRYDYEPSVFIDCRKDLERAVASLAKEIDASSAENPLYFIVAGPMEVPYLGVQRSQPEKRKFVYCISHSRWNDGYASKYKFTHTKRSVIELDVNWVQIRDQNPLLSTSPYGQPAKLETWQPWHWMRDSADSKVRFLWERMQISTRPDPSDAGMAYFLVSGDEGADPAKLQRLLDGHLRPPQIGERQQIRLEAENFRELASCDVEDRNDRNASHRLSVKPSQAGIGRISTRFAEPFNASQGRYDVDVRHADIGPEHTPLTLLINGKPQGASWEPSGNNQAWATHTVPDVAIGAGDEISIEIRGAGSRVDYVQLNRR